MTRFRRCLRPFAVAWLVFQATSLSALVPRACCLAHQAHQAATTPAAANEDQAPASHCAKPPEGATATSMRAGHGSGHSARPTESPRHECTIRGTCGGPAAALFSVISTEGVLTRSVTVPFDFLQASTPIVDRDRLIRHFEPPDAPPPRA
jgi:hypothetical protein